MRQIDKATVEALQGRAPGACRTDHDDLLARLKSGQIFGNCSEPQRETMWPKVCSASRTQLIPSLFTFFEDRKFLACAAECMKSIVDTGPRDTIAGRLEDMFTDVNQQSDRCVIQISDRSFGTIAGDAALRFDLGIHHLWLAAFRMYQDVPTDAQKKDRLAKARTKPDESALYDLASLFSRFGFESEKVRKILQASPDRTIAEHALLAARKPGRFQYANREQRIQQVVDVFATAVPISEAEASKHSDASIRVQPPKRYGIPHDLDHERDKARLFLPQFDEAVESDQADLPSLFIRKAVYLAYFGRPPSTEGCIVSSETANPGGSIALPTPPPLQTVSNSVERSSTRITPTLTPEQAMPQGHSQQANALKSELQQLLRDTASEQRKLDRLRALLTAEQAKIEEKEIQLELLAEKEEEQHAKLRWLEEMGQQQQENLDQLIQSVHEKQERQRTQTALALWDGPLLEAEELLKDEGSQAKGQQHPIGVTLRRTRAKNDRAALKGEAAAEVAVIEPHFEETDRRDCIERPLSKTWKDAHDALQRQIARDNRLHHSSDGAAQHMFGDVGSEHNLQVPIQSAPDLQEPLKTFGPNFTSKRRRSS